VCTTGPKCTADTNGFQACKKSNPSLFWGNGQRKTINRWTTIAPSFGKGVLIKMKLNYTAVLKVAIRSVPRN